MAAQRLGDGSSVVPALPRDNRRFASKRHELSKATKLKMRADSGVDIIQFVERNDARLARQCVEEQPLTDEVPRSVNDICSCCYSNTNAVVPNISEATISEQEPGIDLVVRPPLLD